MANLPTHDPDHLTKLWQLSAHDLAVAFFRRALRADLSLTEVLAALNFKDVCADLSQIKLADVLPGAAAAAPAPVAAVAARPASSVAPVAPRRNKSGSRRRRPQQTQQIKQLMLSWIRDSDSGIKTPQLADKLQQQGMEVDTATTNLILKSMEEAGEIKGDQSRPRLWRAKTRGRTVPEPVVVIRRAPEPTPPAPAAAPPRPALAEVVASNGRTPAALLSQAEVNAAANALRERFFAKS